MKPIEISHDNKLKPKRKVNANRPHFVYGLGFYVKGDNEYIGQAAVESKEDAAYELRTRTSHQWHAARREKQEALEKVKMGEKFRLTGVARGYCHTTSPDAIGMRILAWGRNRAEALRIRAKLIKKYKPKLNNKHYNAS